MVGEELLALQGIPSDDLLLTKETEDQLKDLAGMVHISFCLVFLFFRC
jgi:hypothetical protein